MYEHKRAKPKNHSINLSYLPTIRILFQGGFIESFRNADSYRVHDSEGNILGSLRKDTAARVLKNYVFFTFCKRGTDYYFLLLSSYFETRRKIFNIIVKGVVSFIFKRMPSNKFLSEYILGNL